MAGGEVGREEVEVVVVVVAAEIEEEEEGSEEELVAEEEGFEVEEKEDVGESEEYEFDEEGGGKLFEPLFLLNADDDEFDFVFNAEGEDGELEWFALPLR